MKVGIVGDVHWSKYSSIVRSKGQNYTTRLENCIKSVNWAEELLENCGCEFTIYLGDFFDKSELSAEELSALNEVYWNSTNHIFLVGNHEMGINDLSISSAHLLNLKLNIEVIDKPTYRCFFEDEFLFLPYMLDDNRMPFSEYISNPHCIVFSHNDIKGVQMGYFISPIGFEKDEIEKNCKLFFNGHLHNGEKISDKIINVGNLTGQNFSEDATKYHHSVLVYDTKTSVIEVYDNPYAFNFLKFDSTATVYDTYDYISRCIDDIPNIICTAKIKASEKSMYEKLLDDENVVASRVIIQPEMTEINSKVDNKKLLSIDHLERFKEYIVSEMGNGEDIIEELGHIIR